MKAAGYSAVIVINRVEGFLVDGQQRRAGPAGAPEPPDLALRRRRSCSVPSAKPATLNAPAYFNPLGAANVLADFSSEGPSDVDFRIKPDLVAPGVNVLSSVVGGKFAFFSGTSMASPHLAGAAAVVLSQHKDWAPWQVRSAITNTANQGALTPFYGSAGGGRRRWPVGVAAAPPGHPLRIPRTGCGRRAS